jgi:hypothetical protein
MTRKCNVESAVRIKTGLGSSDTFKVMCKDSWNTHFWYMSPKLGQYAFYSKKKNSGAVTEKPEYVKAELPN